MQVSMLYTYGQYHYYSLKSTQHNKLQIRIPIITVIIEDKLTGWLMNNTLAAIFWIQCSNIIEKQSNDAL